MARLMRWGRRVLIFLVTVAAVIAFIFFLWMRDRYIVPVLTYHNVSDSKDPLLLNNVTTRSFAWQMKFLNKHGYNVISMGDFIRGHKKGRAFDRNTVIITFDDGYEDNYAKAFPILKLYEFPATVFLISDKVGSPGFLTWDEVREMDDNDFTAGAHTRSHGYLPDEPLAAAQDEIAGSKKIIEEHLGHRIDYFSYPSGGFTDEIEGLVKRAGYKAAFTTNRGKSRLNHDFYALRRIHMKDGDNALSLWAKLSGYYNFFRKGKDAY